MAFTMRTELKNDPRPSLVRVTAVLLSLPITSVTYSFSFAAFLLACTQAQTFHLMVDQYRLHAVLGLYDSHENQLSVPEGLTLEMQDAVLYDGRCMVV